MKGFYLLLGYSVDKLRFTRMQLIVKFKAECKNRTRSASTIRIDGPPLGDAFPVFPYSTSLLTTRLIAGLSMGSIWANSDAVHSWSIKESLILINVKSRLLSP